MLSDLESLPQAQLGDYLLRFELEDLTEFGQQVAVKELRETDEVKLEAIAELRELLKGNLMVFLPYSSLMEMRAPGCSLKLFRIFFAFDYL